MSFCIKHTVVSSFKKSCFGNLRSSFWILSHFFGGFCNNPLTSYLCSLSFISLILSSLLAHSLWNWHTDKMVESGKNKSIQLNDLSTTNSLAITIQVEKQPISQRTEAFLRTASHFWPRSAPKGNHHPFSKTTFPTDLIVLPCRHASLNIALWFYLFPEL